jgi:DnaJ homolog subfamily A member 2
VIIVAQEQPHKKFKRKGADLLMEKQITLHEALTGVDFVVTHLDGVKIRIRNEPGEVIKPDDLKTVTGKGLPFHKKAYETGNLYIIFKVSFPDHITNNQVEALKLCLHAVNKKKEEDDDMETSETCKLVKYDESARNTHA